MTLTRMQASRRKSGLAWAKNHRGLINEKNRQRYKRNKEHEMEIQRVWRLNNPTYMKEYWKRHDARRRELGFCPINAQFDGSEAHHFSKDDVIYIPKTIHQSIRHNVHTGENMEKINDLAFAWYME